MGVLKDKKDNDAGKVCVLAELIPVDVLPEKDLGLPPDFRVGMMYFRDIVAKDLKNTEFMSKQVSLF